MATPRPGDTIAVWFSNGAASAIAWQETLKQYPECEVIAVNNPVGEEDGDNLRFAADVAAWLGRPLAYATNNRFPKALAVEVWDVEKGMVFVSGAPCTRALKKQARQQFERRHHIDWHVLGFTTDERRRYDRFVLTERENVLPVLIDAGLTKQDCIGRLEAAGIAPPRVYAEDYPNANCIGCVKATSPTYWNLVRRTRPEVFAARAEQSRRLGARLVRYQGKRIFLDELPPEAVGRPLKSMNIECGIFCEEPSAPTLPQDQKDAPATTTQQTEGLRHE